MYKNITVNPISHLQGNMLFVTLIFKKYSFKTSAEKPPLLYYLRNRRDDRFLSNFYLSILHKYSKDLTTVRNILEQKNTIINRNSVYEKNIEQKNKKVTNFYHKNVLKNSRQENQKSINFYDKNLMHTTNPFTQNILNEVNLRQKNQKSTNFYHENLMHTNTRDTINEIFSYKTTTPPRNNIHSITPFRHQNRTQNSIQNTTIQDATIIYNKEEGKTVLSEPMINEEVLKKIIKERNIIKNSHFESSAVTESNINNINPYDIKKLATKIYPFIINQWQKEFERRGVFYG